MHVHRECQLHEKTNEMKELGDGCQSLRDTQIDETFKSKMSFRCNVSLNET
jgi:hypothetical protein